MIEQTTLKEAFELIMEERRRQVRKWGIQDHDDLVWLSILGEEFGEVAQAMCPDGVGGYVHDANIDEELAHVGAVALSALENRLRRRAQMEAA